MNLSSILSTCNDLSGIRPLEETIFLDAVNDNEVMHIFKQLNDTNSRDIDGLQLQPIKSAFDIILPCLMHIFNLCIAKAVFPSRMQIARVSVIFKKGDKNDDLGNYRPISVLPVFSKMFEKIIYVRLSKFERKHHIVTSAQYGF